MTIPIPILLYHSVTDEPVPWIAPFAVTPRLFREHLDAIVASGRTAMTVTGLVEALDGDRTMPPDPVLITFDDGFADSIAAAEMIAHHSLPSTLYVTTGAMRGGGHCAELAIPPAPMLFWSQISYLEQLGAEVGSHSHTHPQLDILRESTVKEELAVSKQIIEDHVGHEVTSFAYPHGFQSRRIRHLVEGSGYRSACAVKNQLSWAGDHRFALSRLTVRPTTTAHQIEEFMRRDPLRRPHRHDRLRTSLWRWWRRVRGPASTRGVYLTSATAQGSSA